MPESGLIYNRFKEIKHILSSGCRTFIECADSLSAKNERVWVAPFMGLAYDHQQDLILKERQLYETLRSPYLLTIHDTIDTGNEAFQVFKQPDPLRLPGQLTVKSPYSFIARLVAELSAFVESLHDSRFLISFLLPEQFGLTKGGQLKIIDTSYCVKDNIKSLTQPIPNSIFVAPELFTTLKPTKASDIYNLAMMAAFLFSGADSRDIKGGRENREENVQRFFRRIRKRYGNPDFLEVIHMALSTTVQDRPKTVDSFLNELFPKKKDLPKIGRGPLSVQTLKPVTLSLPVLKRALSDANYHLANSISSKTVQALLKQGDDAVRGEAMLLLCRMWGASGVIHRMSEFEEQIGKVHLNQGQLNDFSYYRALKFYSEQKLSAARKELSKVTTPNHLAVNLGAMICQQEGTWEEGASSYEEAVRLAGAAKDRFNASIYRANQASLYQSMGRYEDALACYTEALRSFNKLPRKEPLANILYNLSGLLTLFGDFDTAERHLQKSQQLAVSYGLRRQEGLNQLLYAEIYKFLGDYENQASAAEKAMEVFTEFGDNQRVVKALLQLGWNALRCGNADRLKGIIARLQSLHIANPQISDLEYRLLYVCYLRRFLPSATLHMLDLLSDESPELQRNIPLRYEWLKLKAYVFYDIDDRKSANNLLREARLTLKTLTDAIPRAHCKSFKAFMEEERLSGQLKLSAYSKEQRRKIMAFTDKLPWIYESITQTLKMIAERVPSGLQQQAALNDLIKLTAGSGAAIFQFEKGGLLQTMKVGKTNREDLAQSVEKKMAHSVKWKIIENGSDKGGVMVVAPMSVGRERTGYLALALPADAKEKAAIFGELVQAYADLMAVIDISITMETITPVSNATPVSSKKPTTHAPFIFGDSAAMTGVKQRVSQVVADRTHLIIYGGDGTGKRTLAEHIHFLSSPEENIEIVDCRETEGDRLYQELFGSGEVTGAVSRAGSGTLVLRHIERLSWEMQNHIIYLIQEKTFKSYGSKTYSHANPRLIATAYEKFWEATDAGLLNSQLVKLLGGYKLHIIPLNQRMDDMGSLINEYLTSRRLKMEIGDDFLTELKQRSWSYNTAELFRMIDGVIPLATGNRLSAKIIPAQAESLITGMSTATSFGTLIEMLRESEKKIIESALEKYGYSKEKTCTALGISKPNLYKKMQLFNLLTDRITREQLVATIKACNGNKQQAARQLGVSRKTLYNKIAEFQLKI